MAKGVHSEALQHVRMLFEAGAVGGLTDRQLLDRFRASGGEAAELAFAALVERHGPMILRVCRRTLRDEHDAQDAVQATFLVLVRKAASLGSHDSLGGWLHGVACRVAAHSRAAEARRRLHERRAAEAATIPTSAANGGWDDLSPVLHEEIGRLPETYRAAVVLCDLEGLTQEQAAKRLGWPAGTVRSRLARGRGWLQVRLTRRGFAPSVGAVAALLTAEVATAAVPAVLVETTVRAATLAAAGQTVAGAVSATALSGVVLRAMFMTKIKFATAAFLAICVGAGGTAVIAHHQAPGEPGSQTASGGKTVETGDPGDGRSRLAESPRPSEPRPQDPAAKDDGAEISLRETELRRAEERYLWSLRMNVKGYYAETKLLKDKEDIGLKMLALERAWAKRRPQAQGRQPEDNTPEERKRAEIGRLTKEIQRVQAESQAALMRLEIASRVREPLTEAEHKIAEAEVAAARAEGEFKQAELKLLEIRLSQTKQ